MTTLNLQAPMSNHTFSTRDGNFTSDESGLIKNVPFASHRYQDLLRVGCTVIDPEETSTAQPQS